MLPDPGRNLRVAKAFAEEIKDGNYGAVLYFYLAQIMEPRFPVTVLSQILGHPLGKKNVPVVCAIHDSLSDIHSCASDIRSVIDVRNWIHRTAVNPHA